MSPSGAEPFDRVRRNVPRRLVHQRQGSQRPVLRAIARRRKKLLPADANRRSQQEPITAITSWPEPRETTIVWKEFDGEKTSVKLITSTDAGKTWSQPRVDRCHVRRFRSSPVGFGRTPNLSILDDQGRRISSATDRGWIMKRLTFVRCCCAAGLLSAAPAFEQSRLKPFEQGSWQQILRAHAGRPTLVHFWGVTCGPCKVELPELGEFMKRTSLRRYRHNRRRPCSEFGCCRLSMLQGAGLSSAENWMFSDGFAERLRYEVDPAWQGDIPRTILISSKGDMTTIEGSAEPSVLQKWSDEQVAATR